MPSTTRAVLQRRIENFEVSRQRYDEKIQSMIASTQRELDALPDELEPTNDAAGEPTFTRRSVELPSPSTPPDAPSLEEAPALARYVPTAEILALTEAADVLTALGKLATPREEHELLSAWTVAGNRAALTAIAVHVGGHLAERAARALKRLEPTEPSDLA